MDWKKYVVWTKEHELTSKDDNMISHELRDMFKDPTLSRTKDVPCPYCCANLKDNVKSEDSSARNQNEVACFIDPSS
eukprot:CAMPEP_0116946782 /NCGR_PEP_ID=MMETSP0467-20121206/37219_1 /TAXON_ID=283647 /ORGANISM="Mesodinium pulex, Strain SPMC105" /LENGTH=76 /DNA_ID=CAMNT_0004630683 /DNA_START=155 /DNA_END=385 /DNA_ORIENTATION=-